MNIWLASHRPNAAKVHHELQIRLSGGGTGFKAILVDYFTKHDKSWHVFVVSSDSKNSIIFVGSLFHEIIKNFCF